MVTLAPEDASSSKNHLDAIRTALRTQVADILRTSMTPLSGLRPDEVYDHVLNSPELLHECFQVFRSQPDLFRRVIMGKDKRPPKSDRDELWCGRSVEDVIRLIVRASAKRHFRATLPPPPPPELVAVERPGLVRRAAIGLRLAKPPLPPPIFLPVSPADELYSAFRRNLLYEWQVRLIPHYAPMDLATVTGLGERILDFREPTQLKMLAEEGLTPEGKLPLLLDGAGRLRGPDNGLDSRALSEAFEKLDLDSVFPKLAENGARRAVAVIVIMDANILQALMSALKDNLKLVTVFLFAAFNRMGEKGFRQAFGGGAALWAIQKMTKNMESLSWPRSLPGIKQTAEEAIAFAINLDSGLPAQNTAKAAAAAPVKPAAAAPAKPAAAAKAAPGPDRASRGPVSVSR